MQKITADTCDSTGLGKLDIKCTASSTARVAWPWNAWQNGNSAKRPDCIVIGPGILSADHPRNTACTWSGVHGTALLYAPVICVKRLKLQNNAAMGLLWDKNGMDQLICSQLPHVGPVEHPI